MTKPIIETQQRYLKLKTGEREIKHAEKKDASPHLQRNAAHPQKKNESKSSSFPQTKKKDAKRVTGVTGKKMTEQQQ